MIAKLHRWRAGILAALLALLPQLVPGAAIAVPDLAPTPAQQLAILLDDPGALCHGDPGTAPPDRPARHDHGLDCLLCPYCAMVGGAVVALRDASPVLPLPRLAAIAASLVVVPHPALPPAPPRAPPPRGPPALV